MKIGFQSKNCKQIKVKVGLQSQIEYEWHDDNSPSYGLPKGKAMGWNDSVNSNLMFHHNHLLLFHNFASHFIHICTSQPILFCFQRFGRRAVHRADRWRPLPRRRSHRRRLVLRRRTNVARSRRIEEGHVGLHGAESYPHAAEVLFFRFFYFWYFYLTIKSLLLSLSVTN